MGHNWVLSTDADFMPVVTAAAGAGLANNYVLADDNRCSLQQASLWGRDPVTFSIESLQAETHILSLLFSRSLRHHERIFQSYCLNMPTSTATYSGDLNTKRSYPVR